MLNKLMGKISGTGIQENEFLEYINDNFIAFGSRIWGGATKSSDYDYMGDKTAYKELKKYLDRKNIRYTTKRDGMYTRLLLSVEYMLTVVIEDKTYQFCIPSKNDLKYFEQSIKIMTSYASTTSLVVKAQRIEAFDAINKLVKQPEMGQWYNIYKFVDENYPEYLI